MSTLVLHAYPAEGIGLTTITRILESNVDTIRVQKALIVPLPHHTYPPVAVEAAAATAGQPAVAVAVIAGGDELKGDIISTLDGNTPCMID